MRILTLVVSLAATPALADELSVLVDASGEPIWLLEPIPGHWTERTGFGNPTVVHDGNRGEYVMYFESRLYDEWLFNGPSDTPAGLGLDPRDYDDCRLGRDPANPAIVWAIGRATSPDGFAWTADPWPVLLPAPGTFYACQVAQPTAVYEAHNKRHLYFKAVQWHPEANDPDAVAPCAGGATPEGGCAAVTGFGYASSTNGQVFSVGGLVLRADAIQAATGVAPHQIGFPRVSSLSKDWYLWYTAVPRVYQAIGTRPGSTFTTGATPITEFPGPAEGRLTTGAVFCRNGAPPAAMVDGVDEANDAACGLSVAATNDLQEWERKSDDLLLTWDCASGWDRWEVFDMEPDLILWYAAKDSGQSSAPRRIGFAGTIPLATQPPYATLPVDALGNKVCKKAPVRATHLPVWSLPFPPIVEEQAVAEPPGTPSGCGCNGAPLASAVPAWAAFLLLGLRRRSPWSEPRRPPGQPRVVAPAARI